MAKQYLDEKGVKQLWGKCKETFALKGGSDETGSFALESGASAIKIRTQRCKYRFTNNQLIFDVNLVLNNVSDSSVSTYTIAKNYDIGSLFPTHVVENLVDFNGNPYLQTEASWSYVSYGSSKDVVKLYTDAGKFTNLPSSSDFVIGLCRNYNGKSAMMYIMCPPGFNFPGNSSLTLQARLVVSLYAD